MFMDDYKCMNLNYWCIIYENYLATSKPYTLQRLKIDIKIASPNGYSARVRYLFLVLLE